jgi:DNA-binding MarR family transcriptional regulator
MRRMTDEQWQLLTVQSQEWLHELKDFCSWFLSWLGNALAYEEVAEPECRIMSAIKSHPGITISNLATELGRSEAQTGRDLRRLSEKGWCNCSRASRTNGKRK